VAEAAHALGIGPEIEFRGRKYRLTPWTLEMTALFETWLEGRAFDAVERTRGGCPDDVYQRRLDSVNRLIAAGEFAMGSKAASVAAVSLPGLKYSTYLMLRAASPDVTERLVEDLFAEAQAQVLAKLEAAKAPADPPTPAGVPAGVPATSPA
jgi:hypothetical protein